MAVATKKMNLKKQVAFDTGKGDDHDLVQVEEKLKRDETQETRKSIGLTSWEGRLEGDIAKLNEMISEEKRISMSYGRTDSIGSVDVDKALDVEM